MKIDIVKDTPILDRFKLINYEDITQYLENKTLIATYLNQDLNTNETEITKYIEDLTNQLKNKDGEYDTTKVLEWKDTNEGKKFYTHLNTLNIYYANDTTQFTLSNPATYPITYCSFRPQTTDKTIILTNKDGETLKDTFTGEDLKINQKVTREYSEFIDYNVDYENNTLTFTDEDNNPIKQDPGNLLIEYYPCFIKGLTNHNLPMKLDFIKETFTYKQNPIIQLKVQPMDAIRKIIINPETNKTQTLTENTDYTVDYTNKTITLITTPEENDTISIHYTPYLNDTGLSIAYRLKRKNTNYQVNLEPNYIQYRI